MSDEKHSIIWLHKKFMQYMAYIEKEEINIIQGKTSFSN